MVLRNAAGSDLAPGLSDSLTDLLAATCKITNNNSAGTCLLVAPPGKAGGQANVAIVVTAAHALEGGSASECVVVMREKRGEYSYARREVPVRIRVGGKPIWAKHPAADVAAVRMEVPEGIEFKRISLEQLARAEDYQNGRVRLGAQAWVFSFPAQLEANEAGFPVLRHGSVASLPLSPLESNRTFLLDLSTFGGDSGAPVLLEAAGSAAAQPLLVGLVTGMHRQTDKVSLPFEERTVHHPLGLAIVVRADIIRQTVMLAQDLSSR